MSSTPKREMVLTTFRVLAEKICTRDPVVTANRSCGAVRECEGGGGGIENVRDGRRVLRRVQAKLRGERVPVLLLGRDCRGALGQLHGLQQLYFGGHGGELRAQCMRSVRVQLCSAQAANLDNFSNILVERRASRGRCGAFSAPTNSTGEPLYLTTSSGLTWSLSLIKLFAQM